MLISPINNFRFQKQEGLKTNNSKQNNSNLPSAPKNIVSFGTWVEVPDKSMYAVLAILDSFSECLRREFSPKEQAQNFKAATQRAKKIIDREVLPYVDQITLSDEPMIIKNLERTKLNAYQRADEIVFEEETPGMKKLSSITIIPDEKSVIFMTKMNKGKPFIEVLA